MTADKIKSRILDCATLFGFEYNGKEGNVDPYYIPENNSHEYLLYFDGNEKTVDNIDAVMQTPFIDGHSLNDLAKKLKVTDW